MQDDLFGVSPAPSPSRPKTLASETELADEDATSPVPPRRRATEVVPSSHDGITLALANNLNPRIRLGWSYTGWAGIVWHEGPYTEAVLAKNGLAAYAQHPLLRCVGIDRSFYRPLTEAQYARCAGQAAEHSNCVIQALPPCHWQRRNG